MPAREIATSQDINVRDYGATGDGVTDDIAALESAGAALHATYGGTLFFPPGIYMISRMWEPPDRSHLLGANAPSAPSTTPVNSLGSTVRLMSGFTWGAINDNGAAISLSEKEEITVENLTFDTAAATLPNPTAANHTAVIHTNGNVNFINVRIRGVYSAGASKIWGMKHVSGGTWVRARNLSIYSCDRGLHVRGIGHGFYESCYFGNCTDENLGLAVNNDVWDSAGGRLSFSNCLIDETFGSRPSCVIGTTVTDVTFDQCLFFGSTGTPSLQDAGTRNVYTACRFKPWASNTGNIALSLSCPEATFIGCYIESSSGQAHVSWGSASARAMFLGCTFGTGTGVTGSGVGTFVLRSSAGDLAVTRDPLTTPSVFGRFATFADADTTPSVSGGNLFKTANTGATTITALDNGVNGQEVTIVFGDANTTLSDASTLKLSAAITGTADDTITLVFDGTNWFEKSRSVN